MKANLWRLFAALNLVSGVAYALAGDPVGALIYGCGVLWGVWEARKAA